MHQKSLKFFCLMRSQKLFFKQNVSKKVDLKKSFFFSKSKKEIFNEDMDRIEFLFWFKLLSQCIQEYSNKLDRS